MLRSRQINIMLYWNSIKIACCSRWRKIWNV